jgi:hypothetical protein
MDDTQRILTAIAIVAQLGAQHVEDRELIRQLTERIQQLNDAPKQEKPRVPEYGFPE